MPERINYMNELFKERVKNLKQPAMPMSYLEGDAVLLMKDVSHLMVEMDTESKERALAEGVHYSEMITKEYQPTDEYLEVFLNSLEDSAADIAQYVADVTEMIVKEKGEDVILVSLARAGTPVGVLMKRYMEFRYGVQAPHYSVSIIRGKGFDDNALAYIIDKHKSTNLQFIDGWTGKGAITQVLLDATEQFKNKYDIELDPTLAVLADPSHSTSVYGTRKDFLIPSACLNSTVSGLVSRTIDREDIIEDNDYHGAMYYGEWKDIDYTNFFIESITKHFKDIKVNEIEKGEVEHLGMKIVNQIQKQYGITDMNKVKPGVGETTRVLLRRVPDKILVDDLNNPALKHILLLAKDRRATVEVVPNLAFSCIGLIKEVLD